MTHTTNFNLTQWAKSDRIQMADFNADNQKIDAALTALSARNCQLYTATYVGNGAGVSLTFPHKPVAVFVTNKTSSAPIAAWIGADKMYKQDGGSGSVFAVTLTGNTLAWQNTLASTGAVYVVVALLDADD